MDSSAPSQASEMSSKTITYVIVGVVIFPAIFVIAMLCCLLVRPLFKERVKEQDTEVGDTDTICGSIIEMNSLPLEDLPLSAYLDTMERQTA